MRSRSGVLVAQPSFSHEQRSSFAITSAPVRYCDGCIEQRDSVCKSPRRDLWKARRFRSAIIPLSGDTQRNSHLHAEARGIKLLLTVSAWTERNDMKRSTLVMLLAVLMVMAMALGASAAIAGEITGNGKVLKVEDSKWDTGLHARSLCAYSGQEDDQFIEGGSKESPVTHNHGDRSPRR